MRNETLGTSPAFQESWHPPYQPRCQLVEAVESERHGDGAFRGPGHLWPWFASGGICSLPEPMSANVTLPSRMEDMGHVLHLNVLSPLPSPSQG